MPGRSTAAARHALSVSSTRRRSQTRAARRSGSYRKPCCILDEKHQRFRALFGQRAGIRQSHEKRMGATMVKRVAIYLRVSKDRQSTATQRRDLDAIARRMKWRITAIYEDAGISGAKGRDRRPQFDLLCREIARRRFDLVMAWSVDRLGRSLQDLVAFLADLHGAGVDLYLHQQGVDTTTPAGKAMFQMLGVFAEFERCIIGERIKAGIARARASGKVLGRPKVPKETEAAVRATLATGTGIVKTARLHCVGVSVVQRLKSDSPIRRGRHRSAQRYVA